MNNLPGRLSFLHFSHILPYNLEVAICMIVCAWASVFTPQTLRAVGVLLSPMVSGWASVRAVGGKKFVWAVSQKP